MNRKREDFEFIRAHEGRYPITQLIQITSVSRAGYYQWKARKRAYKQDKKDEQLYKKLLEIHREHKGTYGRYRMKLRLKNKYKRIVNPKRIRRVMRKYGLECRIRRKRFKRTVQPHGKIPNILNRNFKALRPRMKLAVDITYVPVKHGGTAWLYVCAIKDLYNGEIVAYSKGTNVTRDLVFKALEELEKKGFEKGSILHSDQGIQFTNPGYQMRLQKLGITQSMSRRGNCWDNACIENFFGHFKCEVSCFYHVRNLTEVKDAVDGYISYYNNKRIQTKLEMSPVEYRMQSAS